MNIECHMPNIHFKTIVQRQNFQIMFLITNIFFGRGLYYNLPPLQQLPGAIVGVSWGVGHRLWYRI